MWKPKVPTTYAEQTHDSPCRLIRFAHRRRHMQVIGMILSARPRVLLDYGAGDGFLIAQLLKHDTPWLDRIVLYEPVAEMRADLEHSLSRWVSAGRVEIVAATDQLAGLTADVLLCMGVLEHLTVKSRNAFYELCDSALSPASTCIIDVPVEIGPAVLVKEIARIAFKGRTPEYSPKALIKAVFGLATPDPQRFDPSNDEPFIHYHTSFDYRTLHAEVARRFDVSEPVPTPFPRLPAWLANQDIVFTARKRISL